MGKTHHRVIILDIFTDEIFHWIFQGAPSYCQSSRTTAVQKGHTATPGLPLRAADKNNAPSGFYG